MRFPLSGCQALLALLAVGCNSYWLQDTTTRPPRTEAAVGADGQPAAFLSLTFHHPPKDLPPEAVVEDWPTFLGPRRNGVSREQGLLKQWGERGPSLVWEIETGNGYSAPSVAGDRLVFIHQQGDEEVVDCLEAGTGRGYWRVSYLSQYQDRYGYDNGPRASPVIDEGRVYTLGAAGMLLCLDLESGEVLWQRSILEEFEVGQGFFGVASTPLVEGDLLIMNVGAVGGPSVVGFDKRTGEIVWKTGDRWGAGYASPVAATIHGQRRVFVFAGGDSHPPRGGLLCIDPDSGRIDFRFPWRSRMYESVNASSPVVIGHRVFISASYRTGSALLEVKPDFTSKVAWITGEVGTHFNTAIYKEGYLYGFDGRNQGDAALVCLDAETGTVVWREAPTWQETFTVHGRQYERTYSTYRASLVLAGGDFLCLTELGHLLWLELSPEGLRVLARTWLFSADQTWTPPVISRGLLYVTQNQPDTINGHPPRLLCYDLRAKSER